MIEDKVNFGGSEGGMGDAVKRISPIESSLNLIQESFETLCASITAVECALSSVVSPQKELKTEVDAVRESVGRSSLAGMLCKIAGDISTQNERLADLLQSIEL